jgi:uncharacterized protein (DUF2384 family)
MSSTFRKSKAPRLAPDEQVRQGQVVKLAHSGLPDMEAVRDFLNTHHDGLGGRPLDVATASDAGLRAVEAVIGEMRNGR